MQPIAIYIHIPFCIRRCLYCDFNTFADKQGLIPDYVKALENEIIQYGELFSGSQVQSIYFGGGTPSLIPAGKIKEILEVIKRYFSIQCNAEITLEANPGTVNHDYFNLIKKAGINRLSLGFQSLDDKELQLLGRIHTSSESSAIFSLARKAGFSNISIDLIYGLPNQKPEKFMQSLLGVVGLQPEHLSIYPLTLDERVPLAKMIRKGKVSVIDDDQTAEIYETASMHLEKSGYQQYEISNWAKKSTPYDFRSKHNLQYWHNMPYLGFGAGAHGFFQGYRLENVHLIDTYIQRQTDQENVTFPHLSAVKRVDEISSWEEVQETVMLGLRLTQDGIGSATFFERYHFDFEENFSDQIKELESEGLVEWVYDQERRLRLTKRGRLLGNLVFREFVGIEKPSDFEKRD
jgi:oxygen-independent coproporphyrinogen-3 oxidase